MKFVTISLELEDGQLRVITETEDSTLNQGIDLDEGISWAVRCIRKEVLGEIAGLDWELYLKALMREAG